MFALVFCLFCSCVLLFLRSCSVYFALANCYFCFRAMLFLLSCSLIFALVFCYFAFVFCLFCSRVLLFLLSCYVIFAFVFCYFHLFSLLCSVIFAFVFYYFCVRVLLVLLSRFVFIIDCTEHMQFFNRTNGFFHRTHVDFLHIQQMWIFYIFFLQSKCGFFTGQTRAVCRTNVDRLQNKCPISLQISQATSVFFFTTHIVQNYIIVHLFCKNRTKQMEGLLAKSTFVL